MAVRGRIRWGGLPLDVGGDPSSRAESDRLRPIGIGVAIAGLTVGIFAAAAGWVLPVRVGLEAPPYGVVQIVVPGSAAWIDGIRAGQQITHFVPIEAPGRWMFRTVDQAGVVRDTTERTYNSRLPMTRATGLAALAICLFAAAVAWRAPGAATLAASIGLLAGGWSLAGLGFAIGSVVTAAAGGLTVSILAFERSLRRSIRFIAAAVLVSFTVAWLAIPAFGALNAAWAAMVVLALGTVVLSRIEWRSLAPHRPLELNGPLDATILAGFVASLSIGAVAFGLPLWLGIGIGLVTSLALAPLRRAITAAADSIVLAPTREAAWLTAVEEERARLYFEIHDGPLQELSAIGRSLEDRHGLLDEATRVREVGSDLRRLVAELSPAVLDDLGLSAALRDLADQSRRSGFPVTVEADPTPPVSTRPPRSVELAAYRIAQEAVANAAMHADASEIRVSSHVSARAVALDVADDGVGILLSHSRRRGFGLRTMERRARSVGAHFNVLTDPSTGTRVSFRWGAPL